MKTIAFFVRSIDPEGYPFSVRDLYFYSYQEYFLAIRAAGARVYFTTGLDNYLGNGRFARGWSIDAVSEVRDFQPVGEFTADLVFNKGGFEALDVPTVTDLRLHGILGDKAEMYRRFGKYQPATTICHTQAELDAALAALPGTMAVVKHPDGNGGKRVYIAEKSRLHIPASEEFPLLVQEFIDMSEGIPGLASGVHDMRILLTGHRVIGATMRIPPDGHLYANVSKGATETLLTADKIPAEVKSLALEIDAQLEDLPRYYAIDFARGKQGWKLVELNKQPGLFRRSTGPEAEDFMRQFAAYIVEVAEKTA